jgi:hypothetical protein
MEGIVNLLSDEAGAKGGYEMKMRLEVSDYEALPIDPEEANDLGLHVTNCVKRHTALVTLIWSQRISFHRQQIITWMYRAITLPAIGFIIWQLVGIMKRLEELKVTGTVIGGP